MTHFQIDVLCCNSRLNKHLIGHSYMRNSGLLHMWLIESAVVVVVLEKDCIDTSLVVDRHLFVFVNNKSFLVTKFKLWN